MLKGTTATALTPLNTLQTGSARSGLGRISSIISAVMPCAVAAVGRTRTRSPASVPGTNTGQSAVS